MPYERMGKNRLWRGLVLGLGAAAAAALPAAADPPAKPKDWGAKDAATTTPIQHVIVIIGENRTFDHLFATYQPKSSDTVLNLLSEGIVNADGTPGPNYGNIMQKQAQGTGTYQLSPANKTPYTTLPPPLASGGYTKGAPPFASVAQAMTFEDGLESDDYKLLTTGGVPAALLGQPDTRISYNGQPVTSLPPGPYQLTPGVPYDAYAESPVHRFYQMWQQLDCSAATGCAADQFSWVEATIGTGSNGKPQPANFTYAEGATSMGFYNVQAGDVPYFKSLADTYSMSDNFHQSVSGGTGANHIMLGHGDAIWFSDGNGHPLTPPNHQEVAAGSKNAGVVEEVENPNPVPGTNNYYKEDGYGEGSYGSASSGGGSYTDCSDPSQPGVKPILDYLQAIGIKSNCQEGHYYLLNNYDPGYFGDGSNAYTKMDNPGNTVFTIPPSSVRSIGDLLLANKISFAYFGDQWNNYVTNPYNNYVTADNAYCNICNFLQYDTSIMTNKAVRREAMEDTLDLYYDLATGSLPAVSFVKPSGYLDGHPASSKVDLFEGFVKKIIDLVQSNKTLMANTVVFITEDEGGGYYDSGYVQQLDYFGDGTRIPLLAVSQYSKGGHISHSYADHVSIDKFIEANWGLGTITTRSRDNMPNPVASSNPYVPANRPAISDLMDLFKFK